MNLHPARISGVFGFVGFIFSVGRGRGKEKKDWRGVCGRLWFLYIVLQNY